ncbi:MAG: tRNA lysidine(34) synthetase TilS [Ruminococcus sp.]|nr:tRNA lysidine(34) synthetase TilS [Ruminococcus sp.]
MLQKILGHIRRCGLIAEGDSVVCGLSGGADSVCLLLVLSELSGELGITVSALHVNHNLRGSESDRDEEFCRELCERLNVPFTAVSCDVSGYAAENSLSTEGAARQLRYQAFADNSAGKKVATAHNANDNLETMLLNLARGTALKGLAGIPPVRGNIVRPLLTVTREEIEEFLSERRQTYVTDSTNLSDDYTRNMIRHRIMPLMKEINPSVVSTAVGMAEALRSEDSFIGEAVDNTLAQCRSGDKLIGLAGYPEVVRRRCIARLLSGSSVPYSGDRLRAADALLLSGGKLNVAGDRYLIAENGSIELRTIPERNDHQELSVPMQIGANRLFASRELICEIVNCDDLKKFEDVHGKLTFLLLDYDKIRGRATVRNRRYGDRIRLSGRGFTSSVKKLINEKIPVSARTELHFIEDDEGLICAEGIGIAQRVAPDGSTRRLLAVYVREV